MGKEIIMDIGEKTKRVAIVEDGELLELRIEDQEEKSIVGNIYLGRVMNILPGMQVAFIDIGLEKNAFLYVDQIVKNSVEDTNLPIQKRVKCGQELLVQVQKDPMGTKGAKVTTYISLPGKYIVYMPFESEIGISKKIEDEAERNRIKLICSKIPVEKGGMIVRTSAVGQNKEELESEINSLHQIFKNIENKAKFTKPPRLLYEEISVSLKSIRDLLGSGFNKLVVNDIEEYNRIIAFLKEDILDWKEKIHYFELDYNIFDYYSLESKIHKALQKKVWLKSGGYLVIDRTEALTVIDVNTGKFTGKKDLEQTVLKTNLEAAVEIAKQLRLRNIGGIIIIDFIDMDESESQEKLMSMLRESLKNDPMQTKVYGMTQLGLVEMTRKKVKESLEDQLLKQCTHCYGVGKVSNKN